MAPAHVASASPVVVAMTSSVRLIPFGIGRIGCVYEHLMCTLASDETHEQFKGRNPVVGVSVLIDQMGSLARDQRPIIVRPSWHVVPSSQKRAQAQLTGTVKQMRNDRWRKPDASGASEFLAVALHHPGSR
jgi:hypothetical protein